MENRERISMMRSRTRSRRVNVDGLLLMSLKRGWVTLNFFPGRQGCEASLASSSTLTVEQAEPAPLSGIVANSQPKIWLL